MIYIFYILLGANINTLIAEDSIYENNTFNNTIIVSENTTLEARIDVENVTLERIVTPLEVTNIKFEESIQSPNNISNENAQHFKPSPQLGTYYDFSTASSFPSSRHSIAFGTVSSEKTPWANKLSQTPESTWSPSVKFPTEKPKLLTINDHPYPFVRNDQFVDKPNGLIPYEYISVANAGNSQPGSGGLFNQIDNKRHIYKTDDGIGKQLLPVNLGFQSKPSVLDNIPWRKIVKFLTAAVPIGLLIGALTPNVINVSPINGSQSRARLEENESTTEMKLIYSSKLIEDLQKKGCERRILCELLLSAGLSKNGQEYAENFLDVYMNDSTSVEEKTSKLRKILAAIKKGNCKEFRCESKKKYFT